jgi:hypothetical protein
MSKLSKRLDELNIIYGAMNDSSMFNLFGNPTGEVPTIIGVGSTGCTGCTGCKGFTGPSGYYIPSRGTTGCTGAQPSCTRGCTGYFIFATPPPPPPGPTGPAPPVEPKKNFLTSPLFLGLTIGGGILILIIIIIVIWALSRKKPQQS